MSQLKLASAPSDYSRADQASMRGAIEQNDRQAHKKGSDIEVGTNCRVILTATDTGARYALTVAAGALVLTAL